MNAVQQPAVTLVQGAATPRAERRSRYFQGMSILLLAIVLTGFSRTLFLRPLFQVPAIPWHVYAHGSVMTLWFVLLVVQTSLVAAHRTDLHRRLGIFGAVVAVAVATLGLLVSLRFPARYRANAGVLATGLPDSLSHAIGFLWGDLEALVFYSILVAMALRRRRRPDVHKRLMLLASIAVITPAAGRIVNFPALSGITSTFPGATSLVTLLIVALILLLPLTLVAYDLLTARRLHRATLWGVLGLYVMGILFSNLAPATAVGRALWNALQ